MGLSGEPPPLKLFVSYSHDDGELFSELIRALRILERTGLAAVWHDRMILPGSDWESEVEVHINEADVVLICLSLNFIDSNYAYDKEMHVALSRAARGSVIVVPILLTPCQFEDTALARLQVLRPGGKAVTQWENRDEAWVAVVGELKTRIDERLRIRSSGGAAGRKAWSALGSFQDQVIERLSPRHAPNQEKRAAVLSSRKLLDAIRFDLEDWEFSPDPQDSFGIRYRFWRLLQGVLNMLAASLTKAGDDFVGCNLMLLRRRSTGNWETTVSGDDLFLGNEDLVLTMALQITARYYLTANDVQDYYWLRAEDSVGVGHRKRLGLVGRCVQDLFGRTIEPDGRVRLLPPSPNDVSRRAVEYNTASFDSSFDRKIGHGIQYTGDYDLTYARKAQLGYKRGRARLEDATIRRIVSIPVFEPAPAVTRYLGAINLDFSSPRRIEEFAELFYAEVQRVLNRAFAVFMRQCDSQEILPSVFP